MDYEERHPGEATTLQCRKEAEETIDKQRRYNQILEIMNEFKNIPLTAKEIAMEMFRRHMIPTTERNFTAPRLNELSKMGIVEPTGKKKCIYTRKTVTTYKLREQS